MPTKQALSAMPEQPGPGDPKTALATGGKGSPLWLLVGSIGLLLVLSSLLRPHAIDTLPKILCTGLCAMGGIVLLLASWVLVHHDVRQGRAPVVAAVVILGSGLCLDLAIAVGGDLDQTMFTELLVVVAGGALGTFASMALVEVGLWVTWLIAIAWIPADPHLGSWLLAMMTATVVGVVINAMRSKSSEALGRALEKAETRAVHDVLTGLLNRRGLQVVGEEMLAVARRNREPVSCTFVDVDSLKIVNDRLGHDCGDEVLRAVAESLRSVSRESDVLARWGGDEFVVLGLGPGSYVADTEQRLINRLASTELAVSGVWKPTVSVGRAIHMPWKDETFDEILGRADQDMYSRRRRHRGLGTKDLAQ
ncbi:MAG: GGDEF domain-containing protein [Candidatus Nanopelagicales bacterium]|nr:GGDEF domain-containing protein [Candidatus Nanopelagicales bacterium]